MFDNLEGGIQNRTHIITDLLFGRPRERVIQMVLFARHWAVLKTMEQNRSIGAVFNASAMSLKSC